MNTKTLTPCQQQGIYEGDIVIILDYWERNLNILAVLNDDDGSDLPFFESTYAKYTSEYASKAVKIKDYFNDIFNISPTELSLLELAHPELIGFDWNSELSALIAYCKDNNVLINV